MPVFILILLLINQQVNRYQHADNVLHLQQKMADICCNCSSRAACPSRRRG